MWRINKMPYKNGKKMAYGKGAKKKEPVKPKKVTKKK